MKTIKYFCVAGLFSVLSMISFCHLALGADDPKVDAKTLYTSLRPLVDQAFKDSSALLGEVNSLNKSSRESVQQALSLARGAALEATLLLNMAYKDIKSGNEDKALVNLNQITQQLDSVTAHAKKVRDQIKPKSASVKGAPNQSQVIPKSKNAQTNTNIKLSPALNPSR